MFIAGTRVSGMCKRKGGGGKFIVELCIINSKGVCSSFGSCRRMRWRTQNRKRISIITDDIIGNWSKIWFSTTRIQITQAFQLQKTLFRKEMTISMSHERNYPFFLNPHCDIPKSFIFSCFTLFGNSFLVKDI